MELSERLRALRKAKGMTQEELASALFVTRQSVYKWESGKALPDVDKLRQICVLFGVSSDSVLGLPQASPESADAAQSMPPTKARQASSIPLTVAYSQTIVTPPYGEARYAEGEAQEENDAALWQPDGENPRAMEQPSMSADSLLEPSEGSEGLPIARRTSENAACRRAAPKRRRMLWVIGVALLAAGLLLWRGLPSLYPQEVRDAQADGMLPVDWISLSSDTVSERELLHLLNATASLRLGAESPALKAAWDAATNERVTREKAAYWLYCVHIWTTIDPTAALRFDGEITETSMRDQYQDMNAAGRAYVESLPAPWEWQLCRELAETGALFEAYDGSVAMDAQINAILDGRCYAAVAFCLAQKSFASNRTVMEADDARFRPKDRLTAREAVVAARRLYESW